MIEMILLVFAIMVCAAVTYTRGRASGMTTVTRPSDKDAVGMGGARAYDYSYVDKLGRGFPVSLRQERKKTDTFKEPRRETNE